MEQNCKRREEYHDNTMNQGCFRNRNTSGTERVPRSGSGSGGTPERKFFKDPRNAGTSERKFFKDPRNAGTSEHISKIGAGTQFFLRNAFRNIPGLDHLSSNYHIAKSAFMQYNFGSDQCI